MMKTEKKFYFKPRKVMSETIGTLNLRIARLQRRLNVLSLQEKMSQAYPAHKARLLQESRRLRQEISQLNQHAQLVSELVVQPE